MSKIYTAHAEYCGPTDREVEFCCNIEQQGNIYTLDSAIASGLVRVADQPANWGDFVTTQIVPQQAGLTLRNFAREGSGDMIEDVIQMEM